MHHLDQPAPGPLQERQGAVEIGVARQFEILIGSGGSGRPLGAIRQRHTAGDELAFERGVLALQSRDLVLERGPILRQRLAGPTHGPFAAQGHLAGSRIEPQQPVGHLLERESAVLGLGRRFLRLCNRREAEEECERGNGGFHAAPSASGSLQRTQASER